MEQALEVPPRKPAVWKLGVLLILHLKRKFVEAPPARTMIFFLSADLKSSSERAITMPPIVWACPQINFFWPNVVQIDETILDEERIWFPASFCHRKKHTVRCSRGSPCNTLGEVMITERVAERSNHGGSRANVLPSFRIAKSDCASQCR
jgi:hypothetical protein